MSDTNWKVGDKVTGQAQGPRVTHINGRKVNDRVNRFEGVVIAVEAREDSDVDEELVHVEYTKAAEFDKVHGTKSDWHYASELSLVKDPPPGDF